MVTNSQPDGRARKPKTQKAASPSASPFVEKVVELVPADVDPSIVPDRLSLGQDPDFIELIRENGQQAPILVRPHPEQQGRYQVAYGHRRLLAAAALGRKIRAIVRPMSDTELIVAQGQENAARKDLSFIERALYAAELEKRGFDRSIIMAALVVDKAEVSRFIMIANRAPKDLLLAIGPAPKAGRPRWEALIELIQNPSDLQKARAFAKSSMFKTLYSDERFSEMLSQLEASAPHKTKTADIVVDDGPIGSMRATKTSTTFRIDTASAPEFASYLESQIVDIYRAWKKARQNL